MSKYPKMSRAQFELIARVFRETLNITTIPAKREGIERVAILMADELRGTNSLFNRERFLKACGVQS